LLCSLRYSSGICFEGLRKIKRNIRTIGVRRPRFEVSASIIQVSCVATSAKLLGGYNVVAVIPARRDTPFPVEV
jgi:hypothetical protein